MIKYGCFAGFKLEVLLTRKKKILLYLLFLGSSIHNSLITAEESSIYSSCMSTQ